MMNKKVAVALSGGVDSSVTALLLKQQGYDVCGVTFTNNCTPDSAEILANAKSVAEKIGIPFYSLDVSEKFNEYVVKYFENSYIQGETPNPCIMCNKHIKWGALFDYAIEDLKCDCIATGHYAHIKDCQGMYKLYPASDEHKDQLYFLFLLNQKQLSRTLFPLAKYKKSEIREIAEKNNLPSKSSKESQDICFIKYPMTTKKYLNNLFTPRKGKFIEESSGKVLGSHEGFWQYTIGQRKGIGLAAPEALYVCGINADTNTVYVGYKDRLYSNNLTVKNMNWSYPQSNTSFEALIKIRYNMPAVLARVEQQADLTEIKFLNPVSAIAKGQACVLYDIKDGHLLGGAFID